MSKGEMQYKLPDTFLFPRERTPLPVIVDSGFLICYDGNSGMGNHMFDFRLLSKAEE
jgi:hypothetical protein